MAGNVTYGSKLYNDLKSSLPDDVFNKKYGHLKAPIQKPASQKKVSGLGGQDLGKIIGGKLGQEAEAWKNRQNKIANMFGGRR